MLKLSERDSNVNGFFCRDHSPDSDVKDVAAHRAGHGHVPQTFTSHDHAGDQVRDGRPGCQKGQTHDFLRDAHSLTHLEKNTLNTKKIFPPGFITTNIILYS